MRRCRILTLDAASVNFGEMSGAPRMPRIFDLREGIEQRAQARRPRSLTGSQTDS
jgi:hypothetical protein